MAAIISNEKKPRNPNLVLKEFAKQTRDALGTSFSVQHISPYALENGEKTGTGRAFRSLDTDSSGGDGQWVLSISFNDYLRFVDMGVGRGRKIETVERGRKARHSKRYVSRWNPLSGETHRPHLLMEMRHLQARALNYFEDYYGRSFSWQFMMHFNEQAPKIEFTI